MPAASPPAPLTADQQYDIVGKAAFLGRLKTKATAVRAALASSGADAPTVSFDVDGVPVAMRLEGTDVVLEIGDPVSPPAPAMYEWRLPATWIVDAA